MLHKRVINAKETRQKRRRKVYSRQTAINTRWRRRRRRRRRIHTVTGGGAGGVKRERKRERALELGNILTNNNNDISDNTLQ
jgi:hypothetical protein